MRWQVKPGRRLTATGRLAVFDAASGGPFPSRERWIAARLRRRSSEGLGVWAGEDATSAGESPPALRIALFDFEAFGVPCVALLPGRPRMIRMPAMIAARTMIPMMNQGRCR